jgi:hypothetical protein
MAPNEQWNEQEVQALPAGEHDYFDRKSGLLFDDSTARANLYDTLSKAVSAFANTGQRTAEASRLCRQLEKERRDLKIAMS